MNKTADNIRNNIGYILVNAAWKYKDSLKKAFESNNHNITMDQFAVLLRLWQTDGLTQTELSKQLLKKKPSITRILDSMERKNLIKRMPDNNDRRTFRIFIAEHADKIKDKLIKIAIDNNTNIFSGFNEKEGKTLYELLKKLLIILQQ